jgi:protein-S-isoprenylcysteine O-methyltransferase Ste14
MLTWLAVAVLMAAIGTSSYYRLRARLVSEAIPRRREGGKLLVIRAIVALLLVFPVIACVTIPQWMNWASVGLPTWVRWLGLVVGLSTIPAVSWVLRSLGQNVSETVLTKQEHHLVESGPYKWVRHPLYTTGVTLFIALGLMQGNWFVLFMSVVVALLLRLLVIPAEEKALVAKFGDQYRAYMGRTGRLLPRVPGPGSSRDFA